MKNLNEVLALKTKVEEEYNRRIKTIDDFIKLYRELEGESDEEAQKGGTQENAAAAEAPPVKTINHSAPPQTSGDTPKRMTGLRAIGVSVFQEVADKFTKFDVRDAIERARPEMQGKITRDALDGVMKELVRRDSAVMIVANSGRKPAIYRKVSQAVGSLDFSLEQVSANTEKGSEDIASINQAVTNLIGGQPK